MKYCLKAKRVEYGLKQGEFAKLLGITPQYLSRIENNKVFPNKTIIKKASQLLNTSVDELFFKN